MTADGARVVGRGNELAVLRRKMPQAGQPSPGAVLVRGDAGMGKTWLVHAFAEVARQEGVRTAVGHCTPMNGSELPFGPVVDLLADLEQQTGTDSRPVLGELLGQDSPPPVAGDGWAMSRLFGNVLGVLQRAADQQPLILVVEDLHWADASSLDFLGFLVRACRRTPLSVVATCRDGVMPRGSAARRHLGELLRLPQTDQLALSAMTLVELDRLLEAQAPELSPAERSRIAKRCDGNPFFALELAHWPGDARIAPALSEVLLTSVDELGADARLVLEAAAILGRPAVDELLARCSAPTSGGFEAALRQLVDARLLVAVAAGYEFRHALLREAVLADMLPAQRVAAHRRAVEALAPGTPGAPGASGPSGAPSVRTAELAGHLVACGNADQALPVVVQAARHARAVHAFAEARAQYDTAADLWRQVSQPESTAGITWLDLVLEHADAARWSGDPSAAVGLLTPLTNRTSGADSARVQHALGQALWAAGDGAAAVKAYRAADAALADEPESPLHVAVLARLATGLLFLGRHLAAFDPARRAIALGETLEAQHEVLQARITLGVLESRHGDLEEGLSTLRSCARLANAGDDFEAVVRSYGNLTFVLATAGRYREALEVADEGEAACRRYGPLMDIASTVVNNKLWAMVNLGLWDEALSGGAALLAEAPPRGIGLELHLTLAEVAVARGDDAELARLLDAASALSDPDDLYTVAPRCAVVAENHLWHGEPRQALDLVARTLEDLTGSDDVPLTLSLCALGLRACADLEEAAGRLTSAPEVAEHRGALVKITATQREAATSLPGTALLALCEAEQARGQGADVAPWQTVAGLYEQMEHPYGRAYALWQLGRLELGRRARTAAAAHLQTAYELATALGAVPLLRRIADTRRHGGLPEADPEPPAVPAQVRPHTGPGLTAREQQVLALLATGATNRKISRTLFISEKTTSVHVSNILRKLGVANRVEAAAAAHRVQGG